MINNRYLHNPSNIWHVILLVVHSIHHNAPFAVFLNARLNIMVHVNIHSVSCKST